MSQTASAIHEGSSAADGDWGDLVTVQEGAAILRISQSTVWRWVKAGNLRAYRIGERRVWLRRSDLAGLVKPVTARANEAAPIDRGERGHERRLTGPEQQRMLEVAEVARALRVDLLQARGGKLFGPASKDIEEARRERSAARP